jgi:hypothetical protein
LMSGHPLKWVGTMPLHSSGSGVSPLNDEVRRRDASATLAGSPDPAQKTVLTHFSITTVQRGFGASND